MFHIPSFMEISLYLAIIATILLVTYQFLCSHSGENFVILKKRRVRTIALTVGLMFIFTALIVVYDVIRIL